MRSGDDYVDVDIIERLIGAQKKVRKIKIEIVCFNKKLSEKSGTTFKWTLDNVRSEETIDSCVLPSYSEIIVNPFVFFLSLM